MVTKLDRTNMTEHVHGPGMAVVHWRRAESDACVLFNEVFEHAAEAR
jgi:hypothetical protein